MPTIIRSDLFDKGLEVKEGYETIKKRLFCIGNFIEASSKEGKITLNKAAIKSAAPLLKEKKLKLEVPPGQTMITDSGKDKKKGKK
jgi:hypothetical protein